MQTLLNDLLFAIRMLRKSPGFTGVAVLTLALGIGMNTAIFSVVNGVLLRPLNYPYPDRIVAVTTHWTKTGRQTPRLTGGDFLDIRGQNQVFEALSYYWGGEIGVQVDDHATFTAASFASPEFFRVLGVKPVYGRLLETSDVDRGCVASLPFAQRNWGSGPRALGRTVRIENNTYEIVGVLPPDFRFPRQAEVWVPAPEQPSNQNRTAYNYPTVAKLRAGVTLDAAQAQLDTIGARLQRTYPDSNRDKSFTAVPLREQLVGSVRSTLHLLMGAVALVLLLACANVAHLLLARATARSREMAIRTAVGAGRGRIARQLLIESAVLAIVGGALGVLLASFGVDLLLGLAAEHVPLPRINEVRLDRWVLLFAVGLSLLTTFMFGLAPALRVSRVDLHEALKQSGSRGLLGAGSHRMRQGLVVAEIALSCVLAVGAGLLFRSFVALTSVQLGFRTEKVLVMYAHAPARGLNEYLRAGHFFERLFAQLAQLPGVISVAGAMSLPVGEYGSNGGYIVESKHAPTQLRNLPQAGFRLASPGYFTTMGIPLLRGRDFADRDQYNAPFVAIISAALAQQTFAHENPIGQRIKCGLDAPDKWMTIVGVAGDVRWSPAEEPGPQLYMPMAQHPSYANDVRILLRTTLEPASLIPSVRETVRSQNPEVATKFTTMRAMLAGSVGAPRFRTFLISLFAGIALVLAMIGVYGVLTYVTSQRTSEFGLRMALGAEPRDVLQAILGDAMRLAAAGLGLGLLLSLAAGRVLAGMLFGLQPTDPTTYFAVLATVAIVALAAGAVPAWRAARINPVTALREE